MKRKEMLSQILLLLMVMLMVFPMTAFAANSGVVEEEIKDGVLIELSTTGESYETPSNVVSVDPSYGFTGKNLKTFIFGSGVKEIGALAFTPVSSETRNLETVKMEDVEIIGAFAFSGLEKLKDVTLSDNLKEIKENAFAKTPSLTSIDLPEGLEVIASEAFAWSGLTSIEIPGSVKKIEQFAFERNGSLEKVIINEGVEEIDGGVFENCYSLREIHIPSSVTDMSVGVFSKSSMITIYTPTGSYAEEYAKKYGFRVVNTDSESSTDTTEVTDTTTEITSETTETIYPDGNEFRGFKPVENLVGTRREYLDFEQTNPMIFKDGYYDVQLWDDSTKLEYIYTNIDFFAMDSGYFIKKDGKLYGFNGLVRGKLDDEPFYKIESRTDGTGIWYYSRLEVPEKVEVEPYPMGIYKNDTKSYSKYDDELYAYYVYDYKRKVHEPFTVQYDEPNPHVVIIKYVKNDTKLEESNPTQLDLPTEVTATPTASKVLVDGKSVNFDAYLINGNNYFKLRDIATVVSGTDKQFEVGWNQDAKVIDLISNKPYTKVGGELSKGDGKVKTGTLNTSKIYKDGVEVQLAAYTINGNNYFKLRDLAEAFDIGVTWDNNTKTVGIDTTIGYTPE